jgi:hypothetical protein
MYARFRSSFGRWWRRNIADECPDAKAERVSWEQELALLIQNTMSADSKKAA